MKPIIAEVKDTKDRVAVLVTDGSLVLIGQAPQSKHVENGCDLFKGHVQDGEDPADAARREVEEEAGLKLGHIIKISDKLKYLNGTTLTFYKSYFEKLPDVSKLKCKSTFEYKGKTYPEIARYMAVKVTDLPKYLYKKLGELVVDNGIISKIASISESLIVEGGNAIEGVSRIDQENVKSTVDDIYQNLLPEIGVKKEDVAILGSTGKRLPGNSSGDIDIGIDSKKSKIDDFSAWAKDVEKVAKKLKISQCEILSALKTVSLKWPISNDNGKQKGKFVQVDLMPVQDLEFNKFSKYTPQETADEPYYKSTIRNAILEALTHMLGVQVNKTGKVDGNGDDAPVDAFKYHYNLDAGIEKRHIIRKQKKNGTYNKTWTIAEKKVVASNPQKIVDLLFGTGHSPKDIESPLKAWKLALKSPVIKDSGRKQKFFEDLKDNLSPKIQRQGIVMPSEIADAIGLKEDESIDEAGERNGQDFSAIDTPRKPLTKIHQLTGSKLRKFLNDFKKNLADASLLVKTTPKIDGHPFRVAWIDGNAYIETSYSGLMGADEIKNQHVPKHEQQFFEYVDKQDKKKLTAKLKKHGLTGIKVIGELLANGKDFADDNGTITYVGTTYDATKLGKVGSVVIIDIKAASRDSLSDLDEKTKADMLKFFASEFSDDNVSYFDINQFAQDVDIEEKDFPEALVKAVKEDDMLSISAKDADKLKLEINAALVDIFKKKFKNPSIMKKEDKSLEGVAFELNGELYGIHYQSWKDIRSSYYKDIDEIKDYVKLFLAKLTDMSAGSQISKMVKEIRSDMPKYQKKYKTMYKEFLAKRKELTDKLLSDKSLPKFVRSVGQDRARALLAKFKDADITDDINSLLNIVVGPVKDMKGKTIAIVPGSFRPPHKGHLSMIEHYSKIADEVIVAVSGQATVSSQRPDKFGRTMPNYVAGQILKIYCEAYGLKNVKIAMTMKLMQWISWKIKTMKNVKILLGVSGKDDASRFSAFTSDRFKKDNPDIEILPIEENSPKALKDGGSDISATYVRQNIDDKKILKKVLPSKLSDKQFEEVYTLMNPPSGKYPSMDDKKVADALFVPESQNVNESGGAFDGIVRINAENVEDTIEDFKEKFCEFSKITADDIVPLGSTGKRLPGQSSGDLDLGINLSALSKKGIDIEDKNGWFSFCKKFADDAKVEYYEYKSRGLTSVKWPIAASDGKQKGEFVQVDLIPHKNLKMLQWGMFQSKEVQGQDYDKSAVRALLLQAIVKMGFLKVLKFGNVPKEGEKSPVKIERYEYKQNDGLFKMVKERPLKKDGTYGVSWKDVSKHKVTDDPQKIVDFIFGKSAYKADDLLSVKDTWEAFTKSKFYKDKTIRGLVQKDFESKMEQFKFPCPKYVKFNESAKQISEGGNAVEGVVRINRENVKATYEDFVKKVSKLLSLDPKKMEIVGSGGKKPTSGDLDVGVDGVDDIRGFLSNADKMFKKQGVECTPSWGFNEVSVKWPISAADGKQKGQFVQIDLMPAKDLKMMRFGNFSADETKTKYKTVIRNIFLEKIAAFLDRSDIEYAEVDGKKVQVEYERYVLLTSVGLFRYHYSHKGKKPGTFLKNPEKTNKRFLTDDPEKIVKMLFGSSAKVEDALTVEDCISLFKKSPAYKDKTLRNAIIYFTADEFEKRNMHNVPSFFHK